VHRIEAQARQRLFGMLVAIGFAASAIITAANLAQYSVAPSSKYAVYLVSDVGVALLLVCLFYLNRKGHTRLAGVMFLATCTAILPLTFNFPNMDRVLWVYTIGSLIASFVISPASSFVFSTFSVLVYTADYVRQTTTEFRPPVSYNYYFPLGQIVVASVCWLAARQQRELVAQQEQSHVAVTQHAQQMTMLYETSLEVNAGTDVTALLHLVVERASKLMGAQAGAIYLATLPVPTPGGPRDFGELSRAVCESRRTPLRDAKSLPAPGGTIASLGTTSNRVGESGGNAKLVSGYNLPDDVAVKAGQPGVVVRRVLDTGMSASADRPAAADEPLLACVNGPIGCELAVPLKVEDKTLGVLLVLGKQVFIQSDAQLVRLFCDQSAIALERVRLIEDTRQIALQLQILSRRLVEAQEVERRRIARELHDEIGQELTGLKLMLEMSVRAPDPQIRYSLSDAIELASRVLQQVREMSLSLRPAMLDDLGLLSALTALFERYTHQTNVRVVFHHVGLDKRRRFAPEVESVVYRVTQEALTNVARHAGADQVQVRVTADALTLIAHIIDEGKGFDLDSVLAKGCSCGLSGMTERALSVGGRLAIESSLGGGTSITAELPLAIPVEQSSLV
jgi:signal transduction histidine kinase